MRLSVQFKFALAFAASIAGRCYGQAVSGIPHLQKQGTATQLIVDGAPFLAVTGELGINTATSLENMQPIWSKLVAGNLNCVLAAVHWAQMEPVEGRYEFALVDGLIQEARRNNLKLVFLWFGSWKNGLSSYVPYWSSRTISASREFRSRAERPSSYSAPSATPRGTPMRGPTGP